jgi:hypothetical protein
MVWQGHYELRLDKDVCIGGRNLSEGTTATCMKGLGKTKHTNRFPQIQI